MATDAERYQWVRENLLCGFPATRITWSHGGLDAIADKQIARATPNPHVSPSTSPNAAAFPMEIESVGYMALGLTKRELFAAMICAGFAGNSLMPGDESVKFAVAWADALIAELAKPEQK